MHPHRHIVWFVGIPVVAVLIGAWVWSLPHRLSKEGVTDMGIEAIIRSFNNTKATTTNDLNDIKTRFEESMQALSARMEIEAAQAATLNALKEKVSAAAQVKAALPVAPLPEAADKKETKP